MNQHFDILVVDDEQVIVEAVQRICSFENLKTDTALDAMIALNKLEKNNYKLIICDIMLPELDGFHFLEEIEKKHAAPVIMTTGFSTVENAVRALAEGAIDFLPKPFTAEELLSSINRGLHFAKMKSAIRQQNPLIKSDSVIFVPCPSKFYRLGYYSWFVEEHDGTALIGVTDLFFKTIGNVTSIELRNSEEEIVQGFSCAKIYTDDNLEHLITTPITGRIIEYNEKIISNTTLMEKNPYFEGWFYRIIPSNLAHELKNLMPCSVETF